MATRTIFMTFKVKLNNRLEDEIPDEEVEGFIENTLYDFPNVGNTIVVDSEIINTEY